MSLPLLYLPGQHYHRHQPHSGPWCWDWAKDSGCPRERGYWRMLDLTRGLGWNAGAVGLAVMPIYETVSV